MTIGVVEHTFTGTGDSAGITVYDRYNVSVDFTTGSGVGTGDMHRSFDGGVTFKPGVIESFTADSEQIADTPESVVVRFTCSAFTSGAIAVRISY